MAKGKKRKKKLFGIPIPLWCTSCNGCILAIMAMFIIGGLWNYQPTTDDIPDDDDDIAGGHDDSLHQWVLVARINDWNPLWPQPPQDMNVEVFDAATSSKVHSGLLYDEIFINGVNHDWVTGTTHEDFVTGFMVTIQVWSLSGSTLMLTPNDYIDIPVGSAVATYNLYEPIDPAFPVGSISLKWVVV